MNTDGTIRILVCTNAAGMGVNFHGGNNIIHFNLPRQMDTFVQQMWRAGRDGGQSHNLILYKTHKGHLKRVDPVLVRLAKDNSKCRHELLCEAYLVAHSSISPLHNCCDVCHKQCECKQSECLCTHRSFLKDECDTESSDDEQICRQVSDNDRKILNQKLISYKHSMSFSACGGIVDIIHGVTDELVTLIVQKCDKIFTPDVLKNFPIWSFQTALEICTIVSEVFGDTEMYNLLEETEDEEF